MPEQAHHTSAEIPTPTTRQRVVAEIRSALQEPEQDKSVFEMGPEYQSLIATATDALDKAKDPSSAQDLLDITKGNALQGHALYPVHRFGNFPRELEAMPYNTHYDYRSALIETYAHSPDLAKAIVENHVVGLHASGSASLLSTLRYGFRPLDELRGKDYKVYSGRRDAIGENLRSASSFLAFKQGAIGRLANYASVFRDPTRLVEKAAGFRATATWGETQNPDTNGWQRIDQLRQKAAELEAAAAFIQKTPESPEEAEEQRLVTENFPVIWGLSVDNLSQHQIVIPQGEPGEFAVRRLEKSDIPIMLVPRIKIEEVKHYAKRENSAVTILAIEDLPELLKNERFVRSLEAVGRSVIPVNEVTTSAKGLLRRLGLKRRR